ncbi:MAG: prepilin-type N-terminal cleavage/methylation domain-containing protein [Pirellula sp.]
MFCSAKPTRPSRHLRPNIHSAFTLLELMVVILLLGITAVLGMVSTSGYVDQSRLTRAVQSIVQADHHERQVSRHSPLPGELEIDRPKGSLRFKNSRRTVDLVDNLKLKEIVVGSSSLVRQSISYSQSGQSPTYAIGLESKRGATKWIVVIGMTGQVIHCNDADEARRWIELGS